MIRRSAEWRVLPGLSLLKKSEKNARYRKMPGNFFRYFISCFFGINTIFSIMLGRVKGLICSLSNGGDDICLL